MKGFIKASTGEDISQARINKLSKQLYPGYHEARVRRTAEIMNPIPYRAEAFNEKIHLDQNEKLIR